MADQTLFECSAASLRMPTSPAILIVGSTSIISSGGRGTLKRVSCIERMIDIPYLAYQFAKRHGIYRIATYGFAPTRSYTMIASFALIFVAFAACQAALTVKFADFLSPTADTDRTVGSARNVGAAKLA